MSNAHVALHPAPIYPAPAMRGAHQIDSARRLERAVRLEPRVTGPAATFVVTSLGDSPLNSATSKKCVDAEVSHHCSLRAAVEAANNLDKPVLVKLAAKTYKLTDAGLGALSVTNAGGTSIVGMGASSTKIVVPGGQTYGVLSLGDGANHAGATLYLTGLSVSGGAAADGAGIETGSDANLSLILDKVAVAGNHATNVGGGIYVEYGSVWATDSSISGNTAGGDGGAIYNYWGNLYLTNDHLNSDTALDDDGGAIYQSYGNTHLIGGSVSADTAGTVTQSGDGGGIYDVDGVVFLSGGVTVSHDTALNDGAGGGEYEYYSTLDATGATFSSDRAVGGVDASGGGLYVEYSAHITLNAVTMSHDVTSASTSTYGGGAIYDYGYELGNTLTIGQGSSLTDNGTGAVAVYMEDGGVTTSITDTLFKGNVSSLGDSGAAVRLYAYEYGGISLSMLDDKIISNTDAGPFSAGGVEGYAYDGANVSMRFDGDVVNGNVSRGAGGTGGILAYSYEYSSSPLEITNSVLEGNHAPDAGLGGAVLDSDGDDYDNSTLTMTHDALSHNVAGSSAAGEEGFGGAVTAEDYAAIIMTSCKVTDNVANGTTASGGGGGGVYDASYLGTTFNSDVVTGNRATGHGSEGGGIWTSPYYGGGLLSRSTVSSNDADYGAGLYVYEYTMDIESSTISKNVAGGGGVGGNGGGVFVYDSGLAVTNSTIADNVAQNAGVEHGLGGGLYLDDSSAVTVYFSTVSGNASLQGAAIYNETGAGTFRDSIVAENHTTLKGKTEADCFAAGRHEIFTSSGGNVLSRANCVLTQSFGDTVTARPGLLVLAGNGGPTETMALAATSPAINAAHGDCTSTDQRGVARPKAGRCDSGAYQRAAAKK
ncbi:MAG TPA: choice-of-anchor Q domain-containing protein [Acidimicrobiales bacterium]|nr:choice-of-anchor Q domain-containing protein [Acidimicrobiales bacterium]